jgi:L-lysine exporter family protein LysE/ArgO
MAAELLPILMQGIALGVTLCCTLGPQSLFVLRQGMHGQAALQVATICSLADASMIFAGAAGFGALLGVYPRFAELAGWGSAAFVALYGALLLAGRLLASSARCKRRPTAIRRASCVVATALAMSFINPQVYLEMVGVVGSVALRFAAADRAAFAFGVTLVSPLWFFGLALAGRRLTALLGSARAMFAFDLLAAVLMLGLGIAMALNEGGVL